jgi:AAHS family benzoate transporter-like MFS transporter
MAIQQTKSSLEESRGTQTTKGYLTVLVIITLLGTMLSAFDGIARSVALPLIAADLHFSTLFAGEAVSFTFLVTFVCNLVLGVLMDRWGRKNTFLVTMVAIALSCGFTAFITQAWQYAVFTALSGVTLSVIPAGQVLVGEESPPHIRGLLTGLVTIAYAFGTAVVGVVGSLVLPTGNWRVLFFLAFSPILIAVVAFLVLREPGRAQALRRLKQGRSQEIDPQGEHIDVEKAQWSGWRQIFARDLRRQTIVLMLSGFFMNFTIGLLLTLGVVFLTSYQHISIGTAALAITVEALAAMVGGLVLGRLGDFLPSRNLIIVATLIGSISLGALAFPAGGAHLVFVVMILVGLFAHGMQACWNRYIAESYPTRARATGMTLIQGTFFLGLAVAPVLFGALMNSGQFVTTALLAAGMSCLGALILLGGEIIPPQKELDEIHI